MNVKGIGAVVLVLAVLGFGAWYYSVTESGVGAVSISNEYQATSTAPNAAYGASAVDTLIKTGYGSLGTVIITGAGAGVMNFYDATTTDNALRTVSAATSTILIASIPASAVAGTYVFDIEYTVGLFLDLVDGGTMPTTTITFR